MANNKLIKQINVPAVKMKKYIFESANEKFRDLYPQYKFEKGKPIAPELVEEIRKGEIHVDGFKGEIIREHDNIYIFYEKMDEENDKIVKAKDHFIANISHELRTPLNGIVGMTTLLSETRLNEMQRDYIETIIQCSYSLMSIINDTLDITRLNTNKIKIENKIMSLRDCVESSYDIIRIKANEKKIKIGFTIDNDVPIYIKSDHQRLKQVMVNILSNAIKYTSNGGSILTYIDSHKIDEDEDEYSYSYSSNDDNDASTIVLSSSSSGSSKEELCEILISIKDTGIGIDPKMHKKIFEPFTQAVDFLHDNKNNGSGLGLAICKKICDLMGGRIWVESIPGKGSTFKFTIRTTDASNKMLKKEENILVLKGKKVLIIDDTDINRIMLSELCMKWMMHPTVCSSGKEAMIYIKNKYVFDLYLVDLHMPEMNGHKISKKIKEYHKDAHIIGLSSVDNTGEYLSNDTFKSILIKPIKRKYLLKILINSFEGDIILKEEEEEHHDLNILIVEDKTYSQEVLNGYLKKLGYPKGDIANNGLEALNMIKDKGIEYYNVIFLDLKMPIMSGVEMYEELTKKYKELPYICVLSASSANKDRLVEKYDIPDYLVKPIRINDIKKILVKVEARQYS